ncbi:hypothetical protein CWE14_07530 [Aliidiomarina soli]|uniref:Regulatory protein RecX n=2 Tax=Aliidiomarina soli TaxID=1928574 RepID=A0A432WGW9_9GAMM|nr:hypothetical protein CWE14_07530 [Aliidiomarina soli]
MLRISMAKVEPDDKKAIEQRAVFLLGRREHSASELARKLRDKGFAADAVDEVISELQERGWQSDQRFTESYVRQRIEAGYGPLKIYSDMAQKGIQRTLVEQILESTNVDWVAVAADRYQRRFGTEAATEDKEKARRQRHLASRGFLSSHVYAAISKVHDDDRS